MFFNSCVRLNRGWLTASYKTGIVVVFSSDRYVFYLSFKQLHELTPYLTTIKNSVVRKVLTRIRLGVSVLRPHQCRYSKCQVNLDCPFCKGTRESERHFNLIFSQILNLRKSFIPAKYYVHPNAFKLTLHSCRPKELYSIGPILRKTFHVRNQSLLA